MTTSYTRHVHDSFRIKSLLLITLPSTRVSLADTVIDDARAIEFEHEIDQCLWRLFGD
jgi:hypothetical protein